MARACCDAGHSQYGEPKARPFRLIPKDARSGVMSESSAPLKHSRLAQLAPLTIMPVGITLSLAWAAFLGWLIFCAVSGLI